MNERETDEMLAGRLQAGEDVAFDVLLERYQRPVLNFVYRMLNDAGEAEDVAQEVFVKAYRHIHRFRMGSRWRFSTWLFQIARNQCRDRYRYRRRRPVTPEDMRTGQAAEPAVAGDPYDQLALRDTERMVAHAVSLLPEKQRAVLVCSAYHGMTHAEIAQLTGCSERSVEARLGRARESLRAHLARLK